MIFPFLILLFERTKYDGLATSSDNNIFFMIPKRPLLIIVDAIYKEKMFNTKPMVIFFEIIQIDIAISDCRQPILNQ